MLRLIAIFKFKLQRQTIYYLSKQKIRTSACIHNIPYNELDEMKNDECLSRPTASKMYA